LPRFAARRSGARPDLVGKNIPFQSSDMLGTVSKGLGLFAQRVFGR